MASVTSFEKSVELQRRIERLRFAQRVDAEGATAGSTAFEQSVPEAAIEAKVRDQLRLTDALEQVWGRSIAPGDLAAELQRIVAHSNDRATLRKIFAALDNDPDTIARSLVEPILARRLAHRLYWWDPAIHGELRRKAESELASADADGHLKGLTGEITRTEWRLDDGIHPESVSFEDGVQIRYLSRSQWDHFLRTLYDRWQVNPAGDDSSNAARLEPRRLPLRTPSRLMEAKEYFWASEVITAGDDFVRTRSFTWWKTTFDEWWETERSRFSAAHAESERALHLELPSGWETSLSAGTASVAATSSLAGDAWYSINSSDPDTPSPRDQHTAVWTGSEMIVWGGTNGTQYFKSGGVYDPATDSWTATSTTGDCPSARVGHGAVWSSNRMYVWGGWNGTDNYNTGAKYNPGTDTWTALPVDADTPTPRHDHVMVPSVSPGFLVWGGKTSIGASSTGAEYLGSWAPIASDADTPSARYQAAAVADVGWGAFIVWGGNDDSSWVSDGGEYVGGSSPYWEAVPSTDAPSPRFGESAVWCNGTCCHPDMIVWGGYAPSDSPSFSNNGGIYWPAGYGGAWTATPSGTSAPSGRYDHTAVMDDAQSKMIVWGGETASGDTNTGGMLDLCTSEWDPTDTSDSDTPSARMNHTAVWTGSAMIVWGGSNGSNYFDDGGLYTYCSGSPGGSYSVTAADEDACAASGIRVTWTEGSISWNDYDVSRTVEILRDDVPVATGLAPSDGSYLDTTAVQGVTYTYKVVYRNSCGLTMTSDGHDATDEASTAPTVTAEVTAADADRCTTDSGFDVSWPQDPGGGWGDNGSGTRQYRVWRKDNTPLSTWTALGSQIDYGTTTYHDASTTSGLSYQYKVKYINGCGDNAETAPSTSVSDLSGADPTVSGAVTAEDEDHCTHSGNRVTWSQDPDNWGDNDQGDRQYRVQRSTDGITFNPIGTNIAYPATSWVDTGASADQPYYYRVRYKNGCGLYGDSAADTATDAADGVAPTITVDSSSTDPDRCVDGGIQVTWNKDPSEWGDSGTGTRTYDVLRDGTALPAGTGLPYDTTSFTDLTGTNGTSYLYKVRYNNGCGLSSTTTGTSSNDRPVAPDLPANNSTAADADEYDLSGVVVTWDSDPDSAWGDGGGTHTYEVLRDGVSLQSDIPYGTTQLTDDTAAPGTSYLYTVRYRNCGGLYSETAGTSAADNGITGGVFFDGFESADTSKWSTAVQ